jgi:hypothetical protein
MEIIPVPKPTAKAGAGSSSPGVMFFSRFIQQREVADPAQEASICWNGARNAKSQIIMTPELSKHSVTTAVKMVKTMDIIPPLRRKVRSALNVIALTLSWCPCKSVSEIGICGIMSEDKSEHHIVMKILLVRRIS